MKIFLIGVPRGTVRKMSHDLVSSANQQYAEQFLRTLTFVKAACKANAKSAKSVKSV
jgi:hypothetical protein